MSARLLHGLAVLATLALASGARAQAYRHPSSCQDGCMTVSAYRDHGGRTDWNCGGITYGGHGGTDFAIYGSWGAVDEGREVVAAADGVVVQANDGEFDRCTSGACSGGGGWGNYVAIQHDDGVTTYYAHQRTGSIAVGVGDRVSCGQHLGFIASSGSSTGPHLHFEPRTGGPGTGLEPFGFGGCSDPATRWIEQRDYASLPGTACPSTDQPPQGWLDAAACDGIRGWALDPDDGSASIDVYVALDAELFQPGMRGFSGRADQSRLDVGNHGYSFPVPLGFMDGREHPVWVYGVGLAGGAGALLSGSPQTLRCDPPAAPFPEGVRRHIVSPESLAAWHLTGDDILHVDDATLERFPESDPWPDAPALISAPGDPGVYLRDAWAGRAGRRHVPSPEAMAMWRLDWGAIASVELAELTGLEAGEPISVRPHVVQGSGPAVYVIDARPPAAPGSDAGITVADAGVSAGDAGRSDGGTPSAGDAGARASRGGAVTGSCSASGGARGSSAGALLWLLGVALVVRRRARART